MYDIQKIPKTVLTNACRMLLIYDLIAVLK